VLTSGSRRLERADKLTKSVCSDDRREEDHMPDVSLVVRDLKDAGEAERLERALTRLSFVNLVNVDSEKGLVALSYEGGAAELERIEQAVTDAGHDFEPSPGAGKVEG
jgi:copper chaperone CopZ